MFDVGQWHTPMPARPNRRPREASSGSPDDPVLGL